MIICFDVTDSAQHVVLKGSGAWSVHPKTILLRLVLDYIRRLVLKTWSHLSPALTQDGRKHAAWLFCAVGDGSLRMVMDVEDDPAQMVKRLDNRRASSCRVSINAVQTQPFRMSYNNQNISKYIDQFTSLFSQLDRTGKEAAIAESHKAPMFLASMDPNSPLKITAAALRIDKMSELGDPGIFRNNSHWCI